MMGVRMAKLRIIRNREGAIVATVEMPEGLSGITSSAEPELEDGQQVEEAEVPRSELLDLQSFFNRTSGR
jgi:hypothetical protein